MSLRIRTLLLVGWAIVVLALAVVVSSALILKRSFLELEAQSMRRNVGRVHDALNAEVAAIDRYATDWANWDDAHEFMADRNHEFIRANLVPATLPGLELNLLALIDTAGKVVVARAYDLAADREVPWPKAMDSLLASGSPLLRGHETGGVSGLAMLAGAPLLVAARPVRRSDRTGPSRGTLIMARFLDSVEVSEFGQTTHLAVGVLRPTDFGLPRGLAPTRSGAEDEASAKVLPIDERVVAGYALVPDVAGRPAVVLEASTERSIYARGQAAISYIHVSVLVVCLLFGALTIALLEWSVLGRLARLTADVVTLGKSRDVQRRVDEKGRDELATLGREINRTVAELAEATRQRRELFDLAIMHDFGTPIAVMQGYLDLLFDGVMGPLSERQRKAVQTTAGKLRELASVRERMLEVSGLDAGKVELCCGPVELEPLVSTCVADAAPFAHDRGVELAAEVRPGRIVGDGQRLKQAVDNLLATALKYATAGTRVRVLAWVEDGLLRFSAGDEAVPVARPTPDLRFAAGIESALANAIIEAHGGRLWTETKTGAGPAIHFEIPATA